MDKNQNSGSGSLPYIPSLDGLRALAVLMVMLYHAWLPAFQTGSIGVNIFFVLSGYLITCQLMREYRRSGSIKLRNFLMRRVLRTFPALWLLLLASGITVLILPSFLGGRPVLHLLSGLLFFANILQFNHVFEGGSDLGALTHLWSISLEEQFYVIWPLILTPVLCREKTRKWIGLVLLAASLVLFLLSPYHSSRIFTSWVKVFQIWGDGASGLLLGCWLAVMICGRPALGKEHFLQRISGIFSGGCSLILILLIAQVPWKLGDGWTGTCSAVLTCSLIYSLLKESQHSYISRFLSSDILVWIGRRSYGIYLWHWWWNEIVRECGISGVFFYFIYAGGTIACAALSFYFVEEPMLRLKERFHS